MSSSMRSVSFVAGARASLLSLGQRRDAPPTAPHAVSNIKFSFAATTDVGVDGERSSSVPAGGALLTASLFASVLSGSLMIPALRPFLAAVAPGNEGSAHAFMCLNMLGAIAGAPLLVSLADRSGARKTLTLLLALTDAALLFAMAEGPRLAVLMSLRLLQGAVNVGALSLLLGGVRARHHQGHGRAFGAAAAAMIAAVAAGGPVGTLLLALGPRAPMLGAAALELGVALVVAGAITFDQGAAPRAGVLSLLRTAPLVRLPALWIAVERFAVGTFVVTFSLYAHRALGLSDRRVGTLISCFLLSFAVAGYPLGRVADRINRGALLFVGMAAYGLCFLSLGFARPAALPLVLALTGLASAAIYSPALCLAAASAPAHRRASVMALLNATGSVGMMAGTAVAGALAAGLRAVGWADRSYLVVFALAGVVQLGTLLGSLGGLARLAQADGAGFRAEDSESVALRALGAGRCGHGEMRR